jgi:hypothetical protein
MIVILVKGKTGIISRLPKKLSATHTPSTTYAISLNGVLPETESHKVIHEVWCPENGQLG